MNRKKNVTIEADNANSTEDTGVIL